MENYSTLFLIVFISTLSLIILKILITDMISEKLQSKSNNKQLKQTIYDK